MKSFFRIRLHDAIDGLKRLLPLDEAVRLDLPFLEIRV